MNSQQPALVQLLATNTEGLTQACIANINGGSNVWMPVGVSLKGKVAIVYNYLGRIDAFARSADNALIHAVQSQLGTPLGNWESLRGVIVSDPTVLSSPGGNLDVFAVGTDSAVWHIAQDGATQTWSAWESLGGAVEGKLAVTSDFGGNLLILARGADASLWYDAQPQGQGWTGFTSLHGYILSDPGMELEDDYSLLVVARGGDEGLWQIGQAAPGSLTWTGWTSLGLGSVTGTPLILRSNPTNSPTYLLQVFAHRPDGSVAEAMQTAPNSLFWTDWNSLGGYLTSDPVIGENNDGRLEAFGRGGDGALWNNEQTISNGPWGAWRSFGGFLDQGLTAFTDFRDGRVQVYARAPDGTLWTIAQVFAGYWN
jgi:hypothetical protein